MVTIRVPHLKGTKPWTQNPTRSCQRRIDPLDCTDNKRTSRSPGSENNRDPWMDSLPGGDVQFLLADTMAEILREEKRGWCGRVLSGETTM